MDNLKYLIAIPTGNYMPVQSVASLIHMKRVGMSKVTFLQNSLVYDARQKLMLEAIETGADRVLFIDSDMTFDSNIMAQMACDLDEGRDFVCGLYFRRTFPVNPILYKTVELDDGEDRSILYTDYPIDSIFPVAGCGFGAVMLTTQLLKDMYDAYKYPFAPINGAFGEDVSFCYRLNELGKYKMWCDSRIKVGHVGMIEIDDRYYDYPKKGKVNMND